MRRILFSLALLFCAAMASAEVKMPGVLGSNMVLQRNSEVNFWGWAEPDSKVKILTSWDGKKYTVKADSEGRWMTRLTTGEAGGPYTIKVSDGKEVLLENILLGEVWICGGQSNMEMPVGGFMYQPVEGSAEAITDAMLYPDIRMFTVPKVSSTTPKDDCDAQWQTASPASVGSFSATAYFFGRNLSKVLGMPIGLISPNWGGSNIETWMTVESIDATEGINHEFAKSGTWDNSAPQRLWNGMILPVKDFTAKGFIWYQGCSNRMNWYDYKALQVSLIKLWREAWGNEYMPFYITQLAPYNYEGKELRSLAMVIEAQYKAAAELENVAVAATTDLGNPTCIHPQRKQEVGQRLAWLALANDYGIEGLPAPAPTYKSMERKDNKLVLSFNNLSEKYDWNNCNSLKGYLPDGYVRPGGFEIAGEDRVFYPAFANMIWWENKIEVSSDKVPEPVAVRYAFHNYDPAANIVTTMGQPLVPFRTDDWPVEDIGEIK